MKVQVKVGNSIIEAEGKTPKEIFEEIAGAAEAFSEPCCGQCKSNNITPKVRTVGTDKYFEWACLKCGAKLALGQGKVAPGTLYPKRKMMPDGLPEGKNEKGTFDSKNLGWHFFKTEDQTPPPAAGNQVRR